ncbi:MAG: glycoside hydrolase family 3 C-terminal domain-containing protein [Alistipes sp.]|nr:glycoside hydrolase family 3 C-terminal domain-containing protein [Alistipes senegalensis]MCM1250531.1 glycoside hydrolase family 3 C-terminal domain-containing protein [Alistipes sp.]
MKRLLFTLVLTGCSFALSAQRITPEAKERAASLVSRMTLEEKLSYIGGYDAFCIRAIPRLGIPEIRMADGPQCVRNDTRSTLYPCGIALAAAWDRSLARAYGRSLGRDARARGVHIMLGPGVNIYRSPLCGRNFEYYGEDPYLASETAEAYIEGMQAEGVMATIKHFCGNNQEWDRHHVSSDIDERTLHEIYLPTFRKAVEKAGVGAVMSSYNLVNGQHMTENRDLAVGVLREKWGFEGIFMSDWDATYSVVGPVNNGLDLEMPGARYTNPENLRQALATGIIEERTIDEKCRHILQALIAFGFLDREQQDTSIPERNPESDATALEVARRSMVLLKNDGLLPFGRKIRKVAVLGPNAAKLPMGGGSGEGSPFEYVSIAQGLQAEKGFRTTCLVPAGTTDLAATGLFFAPDGQPGLRGAFFANRTLEGAPVVTTSDRAIDFYWAGSPAEGVPEDHFSACWTGTFRPKKSQRAIFTVSGDDGYRLFVDGEEVAEHWSDHSLSTQSATLDVEAGRSYDIRLEFYDNVRTAEIRLQYASCIPAEQERALAAADAVVYCAGFDKTSEGENFDRPFSLPDEQIEEIAAAAARNPRLIVVVNAGGGFDCTQIADKAQAVLLAWYPGQEGGTAVADILTGRTNPSGRLPISIERRPEENPVYDNYRENVFRFQQSPLSRVCYNEGVFVGYRGYDRTGTEPMYPFGYGLSYTTFSYDNLRIEPAGESWKVSFDVTNTGKRTGTETAQLYVSDCEASVARPEKELKGYERITLAPGRTKRVEILLDRDAFAYYDIVRHDFTVEPGEFIVSVGSSSRDLKLSQTIILD